LEDEPPPERGLFLWGSNAKNRKLMQSQRTPRKSGIDARKPLDPEHIISHHLAPKLMELFGLRLEPVPPDIK